MKKMLFLEDEEEEGVVRRSTTQMIKSNHPNFQSSYDAHFHFLIPIFFSRTNCPK